MIHFFRKLALKAERCVHWQDIITQHKKIGMIEQPSFDTENQRQLAAQYQIRSVPTLAIFKQGGNIAWQAVRWSLAI